ncbi:hypothetical protein R3P38DRAFT_3298634 [Favolaschia claudopus]|uniref:Uncharacterized protein n=1 Tax=Favolaschia claudopus TaxID=2862362 RepID=A0AAV9Z2V1_9AGAR
MRFNFPFSDTLGFTGGKIKRRHDINQALRQLLSFLNPLPYNAVLPRDYLGHALVGARQNVGHQGLDHFAGWFHHCDGTVHVDCTAPYHPITPARPDLLQHPDVKNLLRARTEVAPTPRKPVTYPNSVRIHSRSSPTPLGRRTRFQKPVSSIAKSSQPRSRPHTRTRKTRFGPPLAHSSDGGQIPQPASCPPVFRPRILPIDYNPGICLHYLLRSRDILIAHEESNSIASSSNLAPPAMFNAADSTVNSSPINPVDPAFLKYLATYAFRNTTTTPTRAVEAGKAITPTSASSIAPHYSSDGFILGQLSQATSANPFDERPTAISTTSSALNVIEPPVTKPLCLNANSPISISSGSSSPLNLSSDTDLELGYPPEVLNGDMSVRLAIFHPEYVLPHRFTLWPRRLEPRYEDEAIHGLWLADHASLLQKRAGFNVEAPFEWFDFFRGQWMEKKGSEPFPIPYDNYILFIRPAGIIANVDVFLNQVFN